MQSVEVAAEQEIPSSVHQLHGVVLTTAVGVVLAGAALPGLIDLGRRQATGEGQMQALASNDRLEIRMLAQGAPVALAQGGGTLVTALAFGAPGGSTATESFAFSGLGWLAIVLGWGAAGDEQAARSLTGGLGHG